MQKNGYVTVDIKDGVGTITFFHPKKNALPGELLRKIAAELLALGGNDAARVVVVQSAGIGPFCAGASFDELLAVQDFEQSRAFFMGFSRLILAIKRIPKFVIVRVQGKAVGGGVGVIAAADYAFATETAAVKLSEFALGFGPFVIGPAVERRIGKAAFTACAIDTDWRDAHWCRQHGLFMDIFQNVAELDAALSILTGKLAGANPSAAAELKAIAWEDTGDWDRLLEERAEISGRLVLSKFSQDAIASFKKRT